MKKFNFYIVISVIIGIFQIIDACTFLIANGITEFNFIFSIFEFIWVPISIIYLFIFYKNQVKLFSPISYVTYNVIFWIVGFIIFEEKSRNLVKLPLWVVIIGLLFGIYFSVINYLLFKKINNKN